MLLSLQAMGVVQTRDLVATLKSSIWVSGVVLQGAYDGLVAMGNWHQQAQPLAEHPPLWAGWSPEGLLL